MERASNSSVVGILCIDPVYDETSVFFQMLAKHVILFEDL